MKNGLNASVNYYFSDQIALNDANSEFASSYHLLGAKIGYQRTVKKLHFRIFAGGDNLLDQKYSLGNDINAAGGRYYNAAARINYYAGLTFQWVKKD
jgi:iron complex outermembrane receptor protein